MTEWLLDLPFCWMALIVFAIVYLVTGAILWIITAIAKSGSVHIFKNVSSVLLAPMGAIFGLLVVFIGAQVWGEIDRAESAVDREASAIRMVLLLASSFPGQPETEIRTLVRSHIDNAVHSEWSTMAKQSTSLKVASPALAETLQLTLSLEPRSQGQITAPREIVTALETALDARRERIILSRAHVNWIKWTALLVQAACMLIAIAIVHCENRAAAAIAMGIFATGLAVCLLLVASHDRPFSGEISVKPDLLLQVRPD
jgi:Protein of unknown function (DUF4239)